MAGKWRRSPRWASETRNHAPLKSCPRMDSSFSFHHGEAGPPRPEKTWFFGVPTPAVHDFVVPEELSRIEFWTVLQSAPPAAALRASAVPQGHLRTSILVPLGQLVTCS